jgi:hypothetical protein
VSTLSTSPAKAAAVALVEHGSVLYVLPEAQVRKLLPREWKMLLPEQETGMHGRLWGLLQRQSYSRDSESPHRAKPALVLPPAMRARSRLKQPEQSCVGEVAGAAKPRVSSRALFAGLRFLLPMARPDAEWLQLQVTWLLILLSPFYDFWLCAHAAAEERGVGWKLALLQAKATERGAHLAFKWNAEEDAATPPHVVALSVDETGHVAWPGAAGLSAGGGQGTLLPKPSQLLRNPRTVLVNSPEYIKTCIQQVRELRPAAAWEGLDGFQWRFQTGGFKRGAGESLEGGAGSQRAMEREPSGWYPSSPDYIPSMSTYTKCVYLGRRGLPAPYPHPPRSGPLQCG